MLTLMYRAMAPEVLGVIRLVVPSAAGLRIRWLSRWCSIDRPVEVTNVYLFTGGGSGLATQVTYTQT
jgi:hypothetical protein